MTYKNEELEAEFNARYDSLREAYAATAADADLWDDDYCCRAESEDNIRDIVAALLPTLSDEKVAKLEAWFAGQLQDCNHQKLTPDPFGILDVNPDGTVDCPTCND